MPIFPQEVTITNPFVALSSMAPHDLHLLLHLTFSLLLLTLPFFTLSSPTDPIWIKPYIIDYLNGTVVRDTITEHPSTVPPPKTSQLRSKDITTPILSSNRRHHLRARAFLPTIHNRNPAHKLPLLVYFHGGAFCIGSPFSRLDTVFLARVAAQAHVIALSLDYTLFPNDVIPAPYDDAWAFLNWIAAHKNPCDGTGQRLDTWLTRFADLSRLFVGGDSAGGTIAHHTVLRAGLNPLPGSVRLTGAFLAMPYFLGSKRVGLEPEGITDSPNYKIWGYVCPGCKAGVDNPFINPGGPGAPSLRSIGCERMMVYVAEEDELNSRDKWYYDRVKKSGWPGRVELVEAKGKGHVFHILQPDDPATTKLINDLAHFLNA